MGAGIDHRPRRLRRLRRPVHLLNLFVAFAFTVMADPVSSVAYAIEAALRELSGDSRDLVLTMALVLGSIAVVAGTYHQLIRRYPSGGGAARGMAHAFGDGWAFLPLGALLVDFTLTIAVSCAAAASAMIAYVPELAQWRVPLALGLASVVAAGCYQGHRGRVAFATATLAFGLLALAVIGLGAGKPAAPAAPALVGDAALGAALLAMPLGMALATGVEAPSEAIAQMGQLGARGRRLFGQLTIWLMLAIIAALTLGFAMLAIRLGVGTPDENSTLLADVARAATGGGAAFAGFQAASALLLLAAAASSYFAGSGLLKALAESDGGGPGLLPRRFAAVNRAYAPPWGLALLVLAASALIAVAGGRDQTLVHFYAVAVFASFLGATLAAAVLSWREGRPWPFAVSAAGAVIVAFILALNMRRPDALIALAASAAVTLYLWRAWVARGRPAGVVEVGVG